MDKDGGGVKVRGFEVGKVKGPGMHTWEAAERHVRSAAMNGREKKDSMPNHYPQSQ